MSDTGKKELCRIYRSTGHNCPCDRAIGIFRKRLAQRKKTTEESDEIDERTHAGPISMRPRSHRARSLSFSFFISCRNHFLFFYPQRLSIKKLMNMHEASADEGGPFPESARASMFCGSRASPITIA